jgi:hypothetical protein
VEPNDAGGSQVTVVEKSLAPARWCVGAFSTLAGLFLTFSAVAVDWTLFSDILKFGAFAILWTAIFVAGPWLAQRHGYAASKKAGDLRVLYDALRKHAQAKEA